MKGLLVRDDDRYLNERLQRWKSGSDGPLLVVAVGTLPLLLLEPMREDLVASDRVILDVVAVLVLLAFMVEYGVGLILTENRKLFVRYEWVTLLIILASAAALIPALAAAGSVRILRGVPVLRIALTIIRVIAIGGVAARDGRQVVRRNAVKFAMGIAGLTWLSAAVAFTLLEDVGADGTHETLRDALWWSAATITTVGYGDITPVTTGGRFAAVVAMVVGISTFAIVTARVAAFLVEDEPRSSDG